jgi:quinol monooxygenase YgiN
MKALAVTIRIKKEKIKEAKAFFETFIRPSQSELGCLQYDLFQATDARFFG